ncbi:MAG: lysophospholipid acyltransferase family protein [Nitrospiraceae bacterium]
MLLLHVVWGGLLSLFVLPRLTGPRREAIIATWSLGALRRLHIRVERSGVLPDGSQSGVLFVANHVSWLDILSINAAHPVHFIAKAEVRRWPLVGTMAEKTGTIFLRRGWAKALHQAQRATVALLRHGRCVALFPEGTSTDGTSVLPFQAGIFQAALDAEATVWPIALRYETEWGQRHDAPSFVGTMALLPSIWRVLRSEPIMLRMRYGTPFCPTQGMQPIDRRVAAARAYRDVTTCLRDLVAEPPSLPMPDPDIVSVGKTITAADYLRAPSV